MGAYLMKILINADDFGLTKGVTEGIIKAHTDGIVQSTTLMMNGKATQYAIAKAKKHPSLQVGIHLVLTWGKPLNNDLAILTNKDGFFKFSKLERELHTEELTAIKKEWQTQIDAFLSSGLPLHHIDSHHHVHGWKALKSVIIELATMYQVPVRYTESLRNESDLLLTEQIWTHFYDSGVNNNLFSHLKDLPVKHVEVMAHPGFVDDDLRQQSSYTMKREEELELLCSLQLPDWAERF